MTKISYSGYRFPPEIIHQAIWLYLRFTLSFRDVEDLLVERAIAISYETVRRWVNHFGPIIAAELRKRRPKPHSIWHLDEVYLKIDGRMVYLWRAVDAEGEVLDVLVQSCVQRRLACSAGERPAGAKVRRPVVWIAGWRETKTLKPIDNVSLGETTSRRAVMKVNANVASKVRSPEGRAHNWRAKAAWGAEI